MSNEWEIGPVTKAEKAEARVVELEAAIQEVWREVGKDVTSEAQTVALLDLYALIGKNA